MTAAEGSSIHKYGACAFGSRFQEDLGPDSGWLPAVIVHCAKWPRRDGTKRNRRGTQEEQKRNKRGTERNKWEQMRFPEGHCRSLVPGTHADGVPDHAFFVDNWIMG